MKEKEDKQKEEKENTDALQEKLHSGKQRKNKSIIKGKELWKMAVFSPFMVFTRLCLPRHPPVNHRLLFLTRFHQLTPGCFDAVVS